MCVCDMCVHAHTWTGWDPGDQASLTCHTLSPFASGSLGVCPACLHTAPQQDMSPASEMGCHQLGALEPQHLR